MFVPLGNYPFTGEGARLDAAFAETGEDKVQEPPAHMQKTLKGAEIPVPKRRDLMDAFKKSVQPKKG